MATTDQQMQLKDAMARAKQVSNHNNQHDDLFFFFSQFYYKTTLVDIIYDIFF